MRDGREERGSERDRKREERRGRRGGREGERERGIERERGKERERSHYKRLMHTMHLNPSKNQTHVGVSQITHTSISSTLYTCIYPHLNRGETASGE